jgi:hypothetical protein
MMRAMPNEAIDSALEIEQYRHGGILPFILRKILAA